MIQKLYSTSSGSNWQVFCEIQFEYIAKFLFRCSSTLSSWFLDCKYLSAWFIRQNMCGLLGWESGTARKNTISIYFWRKSLSLSYRTSFPQSDLVYLNMFKSWENQYCSLEILNSKHYTVYTHLKKKQWSSQESCCKWTLRPMEVSSICLSCLGVLKYCEKLFKKANLGHLQKFSKKLNQKNNQVQHTETHDIYSAYHFVKNSTSQNCYKSFVAFHGLFIPFFCIGVRKEPFRTPLNLGRKMRYPT